MRQVWPKVTWEDIPTGDVIKCDTGPATPRCGHLKSFTQRLLMACLLACLLGFALIYLAPCCPVGVKVIWEGEVE